jgi:hypothetical protein
MTPFVFHAKVLKIWGTKRVGKATILLHGQSIIRNIAKPRPGEQILINRTLTYSIHPDDGKSWLLVSMKVVEDDDLTLESIANS